MPSIILRGRWCDTVLNVLTATKYHIQILLGGYNSKVWKKIFSIQQSGMRFYTKLIILMGLYE